jgi:hypothetical protein
MSKTGRDPAQFKYVLNYDFDQMFERFCHVIYNIYVDMFLRCSRVNYEDVKHKYPPYLHQENFAKLKVLALI